MHAIIDADIFSYSFGGTKAPNGSPLPWPFLVSRIDGQIQRILDATQADTYQLYLTSEDKSNFRIKIASIRPYKGHRTTLKPYWYLGIREFLVAHRGAQEVSGYEADDALSIEQTSYLHWNTDGTHEWIGEESIICSLDKDLMMVPGHHYNWRKNEITWVDQLTGLTSFYCQLLTGDSTDNIPGLYGVGKSSKLLRDVSDCTDEYSMYGLVREQYEKRFGSYWRQFLEENALLLWMLQGEDTEEVCHRLEKLEKRRLLEEELKEQTNIDQV